MLECLCSVPSSGCDFDFLYPGVINDASSSCVTATHVGRTCTGFWAPGCDLVLPCRHLDSDLVNGESLSDTVSLLYSICLSDE